MFAARILCATLLATTITGQSYFSTSSTTLESSEPMFQKTEIATFTYRNRLLRVWASNSNRYEIPTSQWQFRYDPLLIPMTEDQGQLVVMTEQFRNSWRTSFDLVLDDEASRSLAFDSVRQAYKNTEGLLPSNMFAIPLKSIAIRIPDLTGFHPEVSLLGQQPCPPEMACYPFHGPVSSVRVIVSSPSRTAAVEVENLIPKCQIYFETTRISFRKQISSSPVTVTFQALRDSYFYTELRDKHSADYVSKFELRRILQVSRQTLGKDLTAEKAEGFESGMLEQLWNRWTIVSSTEFKPRNWTRTYKADQSGNDVISDALNGIFVFEERVQKFTLNFNSAKNRGLFPSDGYANQRLTESELKRYLEDNGIHIDFRSNKIIVRTLDFVKVDWSEFIDPNTLSQPLFSYLPLQVEKESGLMDFSSFRAKQVLNENNVYKTLNCLEDHDTRFKILEMSQDNLARIKNHLRSAEKLSMSADARLEGVLALTRNLSTAVEKISTSTETRLKEFNSTVTSDLKDRMHAFETKTINEVSVLTKNLSSSLENFSISTETRLGELNLTITSALTDRMHAFETKTMNEVSALARKLSTSVDKLSMSTETRLEELKSKGTSERVRMDTFDKKINEVSVSTRSRLASMEKISTSTETRLAELNSTVTSELRDKKSVSVQLFETVSKELAENWLCKPEWKLFCTSEKCSCYFFVTAALDWHKALYNCKRLGGDLASIHSDEESEFIGKILNATQFGVWIGLNDATKEGRFEWTDGSSVDFTNWDPSNFPRDDEDWVSIYNGTSLKWFDGTSLNGTGTGKHSVCKEQINIEEIRSSESFMKELSIKLTNRQTQNLGKAVEHSVCDPGWKLHCDSISCNCYFYDLKGRSWSDALSNCKSLGSDLISIHSYDEMRFVKELVEVTGKTGVWIGLTKTGCESEFAWSDGTPMDISGWDASQPENKCMEHCGFVGSATGKWYSIDCENFLSSVCKMKIPRTS